MTRYYDEQDAPPPSSAILFDKHGRPWKLTTAMPIEGGWMPRWTMLGMSDPHLWTDMLDYGPFTDAQPAQSEPEPLPESAVTPEIRSQALGHALSVSSALAASLTDDQLTAVFDRNPHTLYELADRYAEYIATGVHPS